MDAFKVERRDAAVQRLLMLRQQGRLPLGAIKEAAASLGVQPGTFRRWMREGGYDPKTRLPWRLTPEELQAFYMSGGVPARAHKMLLEAGVPTQSLPSYYRALHRELSLAERAYAREGEEGWRKHSVYLRWEPELGTMV